MSGFIIGLTGGVASGKSELTRRFEAMGVHVVDADVVAREVVAPGQPALARIADQFGKDVLQADGSLDRRRLRERVFADPASREALEAITHPTIRTVLEARCRAAPGPYAIAAIPLLAEAWNRRDEGGMPARPFPPDLAPAAGSDAPGQPRPGHHPVYPWLDRILVVDAPEALQHARLMRRDGIDAELAGRMIAAQASRQARLAIADDVVLNDGDPAHLDALVADLDRRYRDMAGTHVPAP